MYLRKRGGLWFYRIGPLGGSFFWKGFQCPEPTVIRAAAWLRAWFVIGLSMGGVI